MIRYSEKDGVVTFTVRVVPRASRSEIAGEYEGSLRVRVAAPPVKGAANDELIRTIARAFGVRRSDVLITSGKLSKTKKVRVRGIEPESLQKLVAPLK